ncbi:MULTISPECIES: phage tail protein [Flavobacterium]|uniref:phage tail protein n=1 Tax=Flavobacterium TaxID=237 RepID=UPI000C44B8C9|nr:MULTISPECIES: phage tail protein [Flavobacterium]MBE99368.1 glycerol acyltransferase [Flavobacterium sp.]MBY8961771.1 phage tail protein [Flavobacterium coralii]|tara:strand:- start:21406 stop:21864 length:459 start_codon:yes stop_codon:yes gene_type:complete
MFQSTPITGFYFTVHFELLPILSVDTKFQSVTGLKATVEMETYKEGGQNRFTHNLPKGIQYSDLVLKRCLTAETSALNTWCKSNIENFNFSPANLTILLLNDKGVPLRSWYVAHAIPLSIEYSDFNAEESKLVIETITLKYNFFKEISASNI